MGCVGAWAGLIAVDSGTYALAVLVLLAHFSIREANAIKVTTLGLAALVSLLIFSGQGQVDWRVAGLLAAGSIVGRCSERGWRSDRTRRSGCSGC